LGGGARLAAHAAPRALTGSAAGGAVVTCQHGRKTASQPDPAPAHPHRDPRHERAVAGRALHAADVDEDPQLRARLLPRQLHDGMDPPAVGAHDGGLTLPAAWLPLTTARGAS